MREVRACDFCGDDATGVYEPLGDAVDGPRLLLCDGCRETLATVVNPLLDRGATVRADAPEPPAEPTGGADDRDGLDGTDSTPGGDGAGASGVSGTGDATRTADAAAPTDAGPSRADDTSKTTDDAGTNDADDATDDAGTGSASLDPATDSAPSIGGRNERRGAPRGYRKVLRFLESREFPIDREEAEAMAADAYGLSEREVRAIVDHALKYGRLRDVGGDLKK